MDIPRRPQPQSSPRRGKSPAERAEEFDSTQRRLKQEAAERRQAAAAASPKRAPRADPPPAG